MRTGGWGRGILFSLFSDKRFSSCSVDFFFVLHLGISISYTAYTKYIFIFWEGASRSKYGYWHVSGIPGNRSRPNFLPNWKLFPGTTRIFSHHIRRITVVESFRFLLYFFVSLLCGMLSWGRFYFTIVGHLQLQPLVLNRPNAPTHTHGRNNHFFSRFFFFDPFSLSLSPSLECTVNFAARTYNNQQLIIDSKFVWELNYENAIAKKKPVTK